jgi:tetratricopeptide (TPR) repeat protein
VWPARLGAGETIRALGNEAFAAKRWACAADKYEKALRYIERPPSRDAEQAEDERAYCAAVRRLLAPLRLNAAAAMLKMGRYREAAAHCSAVLEAAAEEAAGFGAPTADAADVALLAKAHFRRGCARARLKEYAEAEADLARAAALAPADAAAAHRELASLRRAVVERKRRERGAYASAFGV